MVHTPRGREWAGWEDAPMSTRGSCGFLMLVAVMAGCGRAGSPGPTGVALQGLVTASGGAFTGRVAALWNSPQLTDGLQPAPAVSQPMAVSAGAAGQFELALTEPVADGVVNPQ